MSDNPLDIARETILVPAGLDETHLTRVLDGVMGHAVDNADIYFQNGQFTRYPEGTQR